MAPHCIIAVPATHSISAPPHMQFQAHSCPNLDFLTHASYLYPFRPRSLLLINTQQRAAMNVGGEELRYKEKLATMKKRRRDGISISARLPEDVCGAFAESLCVVKYSTDPFAEMRGSMLEMIREVGVRDWKDVEELVYCYISLNSPDLHHIIGDAFLSLCHVKD